MITKEKILSTVNYKVVNKNDKKDGCIAMPFLDLVAHYIFDVDFEDYDDAKGYVNSKMLNDLGISIDELDAYATRNARKIGYTVMTMAEKFAGMFGYHTDELPPMDRPMYIISAKDDFGARAILEVKLFEDLSLELDDDLYILPSSIYEILAIPCDDWDVEDLRDMVKGINDAEVAPNERLSYEVYKYTRATKTITIA